MNSPMLDLVIVLGFTYLLLSILASTIYEGVITRLRARGHSLKDAIDTLFFCDDWKNRIGKEIQDSPHIQALKRQKGSLPTYIPSSSFALAMIGIIRKGDLGQLDVGKMREKLQAADCPITGDARELLLNLLDNATDYQDFVKKVEQFYDDSMDRVTGWFKLKYQKVMLITAAFLAIGLNIDTIHISKTLWKDKAALSAITDKVANDFNQIQYTDSGTFTYKDSSGEYRVNIHSKIDTSRIPIDSAKTLIKENTHTIKTIHTQLLSTGIPMGWTPENYPGRLSRITLGSWSIKLVGWTITTLAIFLGAPFWFDLLSKLINLRGTGAKPKPTEKGNK